MPQVELDQQVFEAAQRRAASSGYASVDAYISDVVVNDLSDAGATPNLDHLFTPPVVAELQRVSAAAKAGGRTFVSSEVREQLRQHSDTSGANNSSDR